MIGFYINGKIVFVTDKEPSLDENMTPTEAHKLKNWLEKAMLPRYFLIENGQQFPIYDRQKSEKIATFRNHNKACEYVDYLNGDRCY